MRMEKRYLDMIRRIKDPAGADRDWSVYVVRCSDDTLYTGIAKDVDARLSCHNSGKGAAYTRPRRPVRLIYREGIFTRSEALVREAGIKTLSRPQKERLVAGGVNKRKNYRLREESVRAIRTKLGARRRRA